MITFELAKELKDAGYEQDISSCKPYKPRLSELIEACGKRFHSICRNKEQKYWYAYPFNNPGHVGGGSTPESAVARLWLALNKK